MARSEDIAFEERLSISTSGQQRPIRGTSQTDLMPFYHIYQEFESYLVASSEYMYWLKPWRIVYWYDYPLSHPKFPAGDEGRPSFPTQYYQSLTRYIWAGMALLPSIIWPSWPHEMPYNHVHVYILDMSRFEDPDWSDHPPLWTTKGESGRITSLPKVRKIPVRRTWQNSTVRRLWNRFIVHTFLPTSDT